MADSPKRVSWDACTWIALIQQEKIRDENGNVVEDRYALAPAPLPRRPRRARREPGRYVP